MQLFGAKVLFVSGGCALTDLVSFWEGAEKKLVQFLESSHMAIDGEGEKIRCVPSPRLLEPGDDVLLHIELFKSEGEKEIQLVRWMYPNEYGGYGTINLPGRVHAMS